jgi:hypothetical protein
MTGKRKDCIGTPGEERSGDEHLSRRLKEAKDALDRIKSGQAPTPEELAAAPKLEWWRLGEDTLFNVLEGVVTGHPLLPDGAFIHTSALVWLAADRRWARTISRFYRLGVSLDEAVARQS